ncbi:helix-turn-helix transcriptional regulator [Pandoraea sputorum]|uniref:helix-turn-helix transcriptional regulator n=1 Tax=Pandoraea sputorum TaxID=93222 RepID=UPI0012560A35|nr:AlpA family phage regulatory protein [Pandoraea sputorum]VVE77369.1 hypothetical protein PSP31120_01257 [Pandoraea sputorum]
MEKSNNVERLLKLKEVKARVSFGTTAIYERVSAGTFPAPVKLGYASRWIESEIQDWIAGRVASARRSDIKDDKAFTTAKDEHTAMTETDLIDRLAEALAERIAPAVPLSVRLWSAKTIAGYLERSPSVVLERVVTQPGFPRPIRVPTIHARTKAGEPVKEGAAKGQPLWKAIEVIEWTESHRDGAIGRPRKTD